MGKPSARRRELLQARDKAHRTFDQIWREGFLSRRGAYQWLSEASGIPDEDCHFRFFDVGLCEAVEVLARRKLRSLKRAKAVYVKRQTNCPNWAR